MNNLDTQIVQDGKQIKKLIPHLKEVKKVDEKFNFKRDVSKFFAKVTSKISGFPTITTCLRYIKNMKFRFTLKAKIMLSTLMFIVSISIILVGYFIYTGKKNSEKELEKWGTSLALNLASSAQYATLVKDNLALQNYLEGIMNQDEISYSAILDRDGAILAKVDPKWLFTPTIHDHSIEVTNTTEFLMIDGNIYYNIVKPIIIEKQDYLTDEQILFNKLIDLISRFDDIHYHTQTNADSYLLGTAILGISIENLNKKISDMRMSAITITAIIALICVFVVFVAVDRMIAPIKKIVEATIKVAQENLDYYVENKRQDELGLLTDSFNDMIKKLKISKDKVRHYTYTLEQQVNDRTEELKESEKKYRTLFEHSGIAVALLKEDSTLAMINRGFRELSGYSKNEAEGRINFFQFLNGDDHKIITEYFQKRENGWWENDPINYECNFIDRNGYNKNVNLTLSSIPGTKNILISLADVTKIRELQKRLLNSEQMAAIGKLSAAIAHEIRNPLGAIHTSVGILKDGLHLNPQDQELMEIICEESKRLNKIINDFLQFARPNDSQFTSVDMNSLLQESLLLFRDKFGRKIHINVNLTKDLPFIQADANQIKQVIINIIINAIDSMSNGGLLFIATRFVHNKKSENQFIEINFKDTGCGINEQDLVKIFQPFYSTKTKGTGMGLAVCDRIIQRHKGEIRVDSKINKGTRFTLILPIQNTNTVQGKD